ncbi:MAG: L-serine ammonia-lyase, iron-sulfur-dependent subunit beta [Clostridia bacterium]|nr:L-serine ammonia-lyase, iron-sulfur-dependent subunit beta [Clostridia bacterium]
MKLFDIIGPVMIGPSSSHTAGAARIGRITRQLLGEEVRHAVISFHGSFAKTYAGHGADRAVIGGLLDLHVDDARLRTSKKLAAARGMTYEIATVQLREAHPNTVIVEATGVSGKQIKVEAASVGGGSVRVQYLNGMEVGFSGDRTTLVIQHRDVPGAIAKVSRLLAASKTNIATMRVFREEAGGRAVMALELDSVPEAAHIEALRNIPGFDSVTLLRGV